MEEIIEIIDRRISENQVEAKEIKNQHSPAFNYHIGAVDELRYLKEELIG